jgi:hypothetical protein
MWVVTWNDGGMSLLTEVVIVTSGGEQGAIAFVNGTMAAHSEHPAYFELCKVSDAMRYGGGKVTSTEVWGGCFNYLPLTEFTDALAAAPWAFPWSVLACIEYEMADGLEVWTPRDGFLRKAGPA